MIVTLALIQGIPKASLFLLNDKQYAISPIHEISDYMRLASGDVIPYKDIEEEKGELEIGGIIRHGPVVYADYYRKPSIFNPALVFSEFMLDLKNKILGLIRK